MKVISILLICFSCPVMAQNAKSLLRNVYDSYTNSPKVHLTFSINVYENKLAKEPVLQQSGEVKKFQNNYLNSIGEKTILMNSKYLIIVDKAEKVIAVAPNTHISKNKEHFSVDSQIDSLMKVCETVELIDKKQNISQYRLTVKGGPITTVDLFQDSTNNFFRTIVYHYTTGQMVQVKFSIVDFNPEFNNSIFDENKFIQIDNKLMKPNQQFNNFKIISQF